MFTEDKTPPQVGDIVSAFLPVFYNKGQPGPTARLCLVLGLEVDPVQNSIEGLWLVRLSDRTDKVRNWDFYMEGRDMVDPAGQDFAEDFVVRTPRIDLLPANGDFVDDFTVVGRIKSYVWDMIEGPLHAGQRSKWAETNYGPRSKLPHTVVKTALASRDTFAAFDYATMIGAVQMPPVCQDRALFHAATPREYEFAQARMMQDKQQRDLRRMIHASFARAQKTGEAFDYKATEARALSYWQGGQGGQNPREFALNG